MVPHVNFKTAKSAANVKENLQDQLAQNVAVRREIQLKFRRPLRRSAMPRAYAIVKVTWNLSLVDVRGVQRIMPACPTRVEMEGLAKL